MEPRELGTLDCSRLQEWLSHTSGFQYGEDETGQLLLVMEKDREASELS